MLRQTDNLLVQCGVASELCKHLHQVTACCEQQSAWLQDPNDFVDGEVLPTLEGGNLTVFVDIINGTKQITIVSPGSEGTIVTPPQYACHVSHAVTTLTVVVLLLYACLLPKDIS